MTSLTVNLSKHSYASFAAALSDGGISFSRRIQLSEAITNSTSMIEIFSSAKDAVPWGSLAAVAVAWIKYKSSREVIVTTRDRKVVHLKGYSVEDATKILDNAKDMTAIEIPPKRVEEGEGVAI